MPVVLPPIPQSALHLLLPLVSYLTMHDLRAETDDVVLAILYYDYALTLSTEVERFWRRPWSLVSFGFYLNRYLSLLGHIPVMYEFYGSMAQSVSD